MAELLLSAGARVSEGHIGSDLAGNDLEEAELAELIGYGFVNEKLSRRVCVDGLSELLGSGEHIDYSVEKNDGADIFGGASEEDGADIAARDTDSKGIVKLLLGENALLEVLLHKLLARSGGVLGELCIVLLNLILELGGDSSLDSLAVYEVESLLRNYIDDSDNLIALHDGLGERADAVTELTAESLERLFKVGVVLVHLGDINGSRKLALADVLPSLLSANVKSVLAGNYDDTETGDAKRLIDLADKIEISRSIENIDLVAIVVGEHGRGGNTGLSLDFFRVVVADGVAVAYSALAVGRAGNVKNALRKGGLSVASVTQKRDIADFCCVVAHMEQSSLLDM